jgi:FlaG/FlaF family flagellin (archaellin)
LIAVCISLFLVSASYAASVDVIGNWENMPTSGDGWIDWGTQAPIETMPAKYQAGTIGATLPSQSLHVIQSGWGQSLAIKLQNIGMTGAFMNHNTFSIDMSVAANDGTITGGYTQIYAVSMNAAGPGFKDVASGTPINFYWWPGSGQRTSTLTIDYTNFRDAITSTGYIEIIFALNTGGGAPPDMYFDNARLSGVPEPATMAMLGLGGLALLRRKH